MKRQFEPGSVEAADIASGRVEAHYSRVLTRLLAAHAAAEKLTAKGYERMLASVENAKLHPALEKNFAEELKHASLVYDVLQQLGVSEAQADRMLVSAMKSASFEAPRYFAEKAAGELDLVMASISLDMTGFLMIGINYRDSSYAPHARAAEMILEEEEDHEVFAENELSEASGRFGAERVNAALAEWLPRAVNFFGPPGSGFTYDCMRYGLKSRDNGELADLFLTMLERRVVQAGLTMPKLTPDYPHALA